MGYFQVRYDSRVVNYDRRGFIRLTTEITKWCQLLLSRLEMRAFCFHYICTNQCDLMARLFIQCLPIYNSEDVPNSKKLPM